MTRSSTVGAFAEGAGLAQHRVDERRLAVVDVGDDRDVADVCALLHARQRSAAVLTPYG